MGNDAGQTAWQGDHSFLTFALERVELSETTLVMLGECSSKIEHIAGVPLKPDAAQDLYMIFLAKGVHGTTAIEGNTLSEEQVRQRIDHTLTLPTSQAYLGQEIDNIVKACRLIIQQTKDGEPFNVSPDAVKRLNAMVLEKLEVPPEVVPGQFRNHSVMVGDYRSPSPTYTEELIGRYCDFMMSPQWREPLGTTLVLPILKAIVGHIYFAWIHPFGDGNGRTARLIEFDSLIRSGVPAISAHLLSDHYNKTRTAYYRALSEARRDINAFIDYAVQGFVDGLREQLVTIRKYQFQTAWVNYVHDQFKGHMGSTQHRRRDVVLALTAMEKPIPTKGVRTLSQQIETEYRHLTDKTVVRDLNALEQLDLVRYEGGGYVANIERMRAFLPPKSPGSPISLPY